MAVFYVKDFVNRQINTGTRMDDMATNDDIVKDHIVGDDAEGTGRAAHKHERLVDFTDSSEWSNFEIGFHVLTGLGLHITGASRTVRAGLTRKVVDDESAGASGTSPVTQIHPGRDAVTGTPTHEWIPLTFFRRDNPGTWDRSDAEIGHAGTHGAGNGYYWTLDRYSHVSNGWEATVVNHMIIARNVSGTMLSPSNTTDMG